MMTANQRPANRLATARSAYLRQHATNPVDWYEWTDEALQRARREHKPIFLSIGYAACHWCHVMAHESFENDAIARLLNEHFISIKVDREERPDLDHIYMAATVAMTGTGGWPMSVFLLPDGRPFFAGTYFPPEPRHGLPSFRQVLEGILKVWESQPATLSQIGERVRDELQKQQQVSGAATRVSAEQLDAAADSLCRQHDGVNGGWGSAPKFPQPMAISFLLRRHCAGHAQALACATHALRAMARGGMYDVVGGGFARYSTDDEWRVPHFEKMLYDNALLARAYLQAWLCTREAFFCRVAEETLAFVLRELAHGDGAFFASLDADSDGHEGAFYVWRMKDLAAILGEDWPLFQRAYGVTEEGNWEGQTVLQRASDDASVAAACGISAGEVEARLVSCHERLLAARNKRSRPSVDELIITSWNGLMLAALAEAGRYLDARYTAAAQRTARFLLTHARPQNSLRHSWSHGAAGQHVFLEDFGALISGLLELYQADGDLTWYRAACELGEELQARFADPAGGWFDTPADGPALLVRPKELQDNATPCGNALAAEALILLARFTGNRTYREYAERALGSVAQLACRYPLGFAGWLSAWDALCAPEEHVAIIGPADSPATRKLMAYAHREWRPHRLIACAEPPVQPGVPVWLAGRTMHEGMPALYHCTHTGCSAPITAADINLG